MFCSNCGKEITDTSRFCCFCGAKLVSGKNTNKYSQNNDSEFIDEIYGLHFRIPPGFKTIDSVDNEYFDENGITSCMRAYSGSCELEISVSTADGFWDLDLIRKFDDVDMSIGYHEGLYNPQTKVFKYFHGYGHKLVVIIGANENQLRYLII